MKKTFLLIFSSLLFCMQDGKAQIALDFENDSIAFGPNEFYCVDIAENESKFIHLNEKLNSFTIYNLDMTPFIADIPFPVGDSLKNGYVVMYVSRTLFDCDSTNIEYAYSVPVAFRAPFRIIRTDGTVLLEVENARGPYHFGGSSGGSMILSPIKNTSEGAKLFLDILNPSGKGIQVYSLCGELPTDYVNLPGMESYVNVYPNPSGMKITFEVKSPNNLEAFELVIYDIHGNELNRKGISIMNEKFILDVSNFNSGSYIYSLVTKHKSFQTGRFIITR